MDLRCGWRCVLSITDLTLAQVRRLLPQSIIQKAIRMTFVLLGDDAADFAQACAKGAFALRHEIAALTRIIRSLGGAEGDDATEVLLDTANAASRHFRDMEMLSKRGRAEVGRPSPTDHVVVLDVMEEDEWSQSLTSSRDSTNGVEIEEAMAVRWRSFYLQQQLGVHRLGLAALMAASELADAPLALRKVRAAASSFLAAHFEAGSLHVQLGSAASGARGRHAQLDYNDVFVPSLVQLASSPIDEVANSALRVLAPLWRLAPRLQVSPLVARRCVLLRSEAAIDVLDKLASKHPHSVLAAIAACFTFYHGTPAARLIHTAARCCAALPPTDRATRRVRDTIPLVLALRAAVTTYEARFEAALDAFIVHAHLKHRRDGSLTALDGIPDATSDDDDQNDVADEEPWHRAGSQGEEEEVDDDDSTEDAALLEYTLAKVSKFEEIVTSSVLSVESLLSECLQVKSRKRRKREVDLARTMAIIEALFDSNAQIRDEPELSSRIKAVLTSNRFPKHALCTTTTGRGLCELFDIPVGERRDERIGIFDPLLADEKAVDFAAFGPDNETAAKAEAALTCRSCEESTTGIVCGGDAIETLCDDLSQFAKFQRALDVDDIVKSTRHDELHDVGEALLALPVEDGKKRSTDLASDGVKHRTSFRGMWLQAQRKQSFDAVIARFFKHVEWCASGASRFDDVGTCDADSLGTQNDPLRSTVDLWLELPPAQLGTRGREENSRCYIVSDVILALRLMLLARRQDPTPSGSESSQTDAPRPASDLSAAELQDRLIHAGGAFLVVHVVPA